MNVAFGAKVMLGDEFLGSKSVKKMTAKNLLGDFKGDKDLFVSQVSDAAKTLKSDKTRKFWYSIEHVFKNTVAVIVHDKINKLGKSGIIPVSPLDSLSDRITEFVSSSKTALSIKK